jgi:hypothetical protein
MLHAVQAPLFKSVMLVGAAVTATALFAPSRASDAMVAQRLELHAPKCPRAIYLTAWAHGDVTIKVKKGEALKPITLTQRGHVFGCDWRATETLIPDGPNRYFYSYEEEKVRCEPDAPPSIDTPRIGYVIVVGD